MPLSTILFSTGRRGLVYMNSSMDYTRKEKMKREGRGRREEGKVEEGTHIFLYFI